MNPVRDALLVQFDTAWKLTRFHLDTLTTEECLWRPAEWGPHVHRSADGGWRADWPEGQNYAAGPPSIGWITWHMMFWWRTLFDRSFGPGDLEAAQIGWPGDADGVRRELGALASHWREALAAMSDADLASDRHTRWPFVGRPYADVVAWATVELTKNAAEIGYARFLYAARQV